MRDLYTSVVDSLETSGTGGVYVQKRIGEISAISAYAARRVADRLEALIIEAGAPALAGIEDWPDPQGFEVTCTPPAVSSEGGRRQVHLQLLEERYCTVFRALCDDVSGIISDAESEKEAVHYFHQRLIRWQSFLQKHGPEGLGRNERCGLFGELYVMREVFLSRFKPLSVLQSWRGCKKANQDFQFPDFALEVKATRASIPDRISVSNIQQLDGEGMSRMILTVVHLHENETAGETLPAIVDNLRSSLGEDSLNLLNEGLQEVGYLDVHRDLYMSTCYQKLQVLHFEVREGFPRLTSAQIPDGVKKVKYDIGIDSCRPFALEEETLLGIMSEKLADE